MPYLPFGAGAGFPTTVWLCAAVYPPRTLVECPVELSWPIMRGAERLLGATCEGVTDSLKAGGEDMRLLVGSQREWWPERDCHRPAPE